MAYRIDITIPHTLSQAVAFERVVAWLASQKDKPSSVATVTPVETKILHDEYKIVVKLEIQAAGLINTKHTLTFDSQPGALHVTSDNADEWGERLQFVAEQYQLQRELEGVVK